MNHAQARLNRVNTKQTTTHSNLIGLLLISLLLLVGCETTKGPAPVTERTVIPGKGTGIPPVELTKHDYIVQTGDTLYSIALKHGISPKDLAEWNNIVDPHSIHAGQRLKLSIASESSGPTLFAVPQQSGMPVVDPTLDSSESTTTVLTQNPEQQRVKTSPKALKLPYSEQNAAVIRHSVNPSLNVQHSNQTAPTESGTRIENAPRPIEQKSDLALSTQTTDWIWPTNGKLLSSFSANSKGLKISGQIGQAIVATAAGEVVYSGDGLRGYGNLIIIKHDDVLLSAYAHNSKLLVKEGESVSQGQIIAEMGKTDTDTPQLHFEIRRHGKPVDPLRFLPNNPG